jgi:NADH dehydrogenase
MSTLKNKVVTVFGGTGFLGRNLVAALVKEGAIVRVPSRLKNSAYRLRTGALVGQVVPMQIDFDDEHSVQSVLKGADYAVNLIGILTETGRTRYTPIHEELAGKIAHHCEKAKIRHFVHISALGADAHAPSRYQRSKAAGEKAVLKKIKTATILRPSIIFGEGDGFFSRFARMARILPVLPLIGGGRTRFQPVFVGDIVETIITALMNYDHAPDVFDGQVIECAGPGTYTYKELMEYILEQTGTHAMLIRLPWSISKLMGAILQNLPGKMLTVDQVKSLKQDNVVTGNTLTMDDIGIVPTPVEVIVPDYLVTYRTGGQFARKKT